MPEDLNPIAWRVWTKKNPKNWVAVTNVVTRREAMVNGAAKLGASARLFDVDCEVERDAELARASARGGK